MPFISVCGSKHISLSKNSVIFSYSRIDAYVPREKRRAPLFFIGENVLVGYFFSALLAGEIHIGDDTMIASNVLITTENHGIDSAAVPYRLQKIVIGDVWIGKNCWIGEKSIILPGVKIGDNSIIGAGSVVTRSIPKNSLAVGSPARVIKTRGPDGSWASLPKEQ